MYFVRLITTDRSSRAVSVMWPLQLYMNMELRRRHSANNLESHSVVLSVELSPSASSMNA